MNMNATKNSMRGLTVFISDLRNAQSKENEEKRITKEMAHIRKEFKENKGIDGYQRRKYVCKLLYIYMLGYDLDFGHMEAVTLISSNKYQEKVIGYIALGMLLHENHEMIPLLINSLREDLTARSDFFQCLALSGIGNIGGKEMAESLAPDVQKLLIASTSAPIIKKRAALALLRLYRKYPSIITPELWGDKLIAILDEGDLGVLTSVTSLLLGLIAEDPEGWEVAIPKVIGILAKIVITREYTKEYVYYSVPNPWLQTKLLRFLRHYPPPAPGTPSANRLAEVLNVIFASADAAKAGTMNHKNALNAVLFEAINLVIQHDSDQNLLRQTGSLLGRFISAKETNIRYLGLEAMSHLASLSTETANMIKKYQETVTISLRDADISIRRRALDLLYGMCDKSSSKAIVAELLTYLVSAEYAIREELVIKIANLAEKFASNYSWYVDVILQLITLAGDFVSDDIWHRVIKIVTNHEDIQEYAARTVFKALQSPTCHETLVKVGGYILGEFGHLIDKDANASPRAQLQILHSKWGTCGLPTRAMLLSTYAKFVNLFPELTPQLQEIFAQYRSFIDTEIQQRACEYYNLSSLNDEDLLQTVLDVIPAWNEKDDQANSNNQQLIEQEPAAAADKKARGRSNTGTPTPTDDFLGLNLGPTTSNTSANGSYGSLSQGGPGNGSVSPTLGYNSMPSGGAGAMTPFGNTGAAPRGPSPAGGMLDLTDPFGLGGASGAPSSSSSTSSTAAASAGLFGAVPTPMTQAGSYGSTGASGNNNTFMSGGATSTAYGSAGSNAGGPFGSTGGAGASPFGSMGGISGGGMSGMSGGGMSGGGMSGGGMSGGGMSGGGMSGMSGGGMSGMSGGGMSGGGMSGGSGLDAFAGLNMGGMGASTTSNMGGLVPQTSNNNGGADAFLSTSSVPSPQPTDANDPAQAKATAMFKRLCLATEGVIYEDGTLQIGMKSEYQREMGRIMFYYGNSSPNVSLTNFTTAFPSFPALQFQPQPIANQVAPKAQVQQLVTFVCTGDFQDVPVLQISFFSTKPVNISLRLPILVTKFTEPIKLMAPDFFNQWKNYSTKTLEAQEVFKMGSASKAIDLNWIGKVIGEGLHFSVLKGVDPSINNIVAAGSFCCATLPNPSPCLVRLETNPQANMCRLTVRSSSAVLTSAMKTALVSHLSA